MKIFYTSFILAALICLLPAASSAQSLGFGFGNREFVKISPAARTALHTYLAAQYQHQCAAKKPPDACQQTKPLYESSSLSATGAQALPQEVISQLGFIAPGTEYVQAGFVVYLIRLPRRIILDSVSATETHPSSNIQW